MASRDIVALFLLDSGNDYQDAMRRSALAACERRGLKLEVQDAGQQSSKQLQQILAWIRGPAAPQTVALLVHPVFDGMHEKAAREAAEAGIGWVLLNRHGLYLTELRNLFPTLPFAAVTPDQNEIGRMQGRIVRRLLPGGGNVLGILGPVMASSSQKRLIGMEEVLTGTGVKLAVERRDWSIKGGEQAVLSWVRGARAGAPMPDLIVAHNDSMACGARRALTALGEQRGSPHLAELPIVGCDGVPSFGLQLVKEGVITATVAVPSSGGPAVDMLDDWRRGRNARPADVVLPVSIHPELSKLSANAGKLAVA